MGIEIDGKPIKSVVEGTEKIPVKAGTVGRHILASAIKTYTLLNINDLISKERVEIDETDFTAGIYTVAAADMNKIIIADLSASGAARTIKIQNASVSTGDKTVAINYKAGSVILTITTVGGAQNIGAATSQEITKFNETITCLDNEAEFIIIQDSRINTDSVDLTREPENVHITNLEEYIAHNGSSFIGIGSTVTDNGDGTVTVVEGEAYLKTTNAIDGTFKAVVVAEDDFTIAANTNVTLYIDYNAGTPIYKQKVAAAGYFFSNWDEAPFATCVNTGSEIVINEFCNATTNFSYKNALSQANIQPFRYVSGLGASETGTRNVAIALGYAVFIHDWHSITAIDTSAADTFTNAYYNGSAWVRTAAQTTIDNAQYNDIASGMVALSNNNKWANKYVYYIKDSPSYWMVIEGQAQYDSLSEAEAAGIPSLLPPELNNFYAGSLLVAIYVVRKGQAAIQDILNPLITPFSSSASSLHNNLGGLDLAATSVTYGHIDDQAQSIAGLKTFLNGIISSGTSAIDGTAPVTIRIKDLQESSGWTVGAEFASYEFYSADVSGSGAGVKAKISAVVENTSGGAVGLEFYTDDGSTGLTRKFFINRLGILFIDSTPSTGAATDPILVRDGTEVKQYIQLKQTSITSSATPTPTGDTRENEHYTTALAAAATYAAPSGTPANGNKLSLRFEDNGTSRTIAYNAIYRAIGCTLPTDTIVGLTHRLKGEYNSEDSKWDILEVYPLLETEYLPCSDLTTYLTTGTEKAYYRPAFDMVLVDVIASVLTAPTGAALVVDINESGSTILSTKLTIDVSEKTSTTAATPVVISDTAIAADSEVTIDIDTIGSTIAGAGLMVKLIYYRA